MISAILRTPFYCVLFCFSLSSLNASLTKLEDIEYCLRKTPPPKTKLIIGGVRKNSDPHWIISDDDSITINTDKYCGAEIISNGLVVHCMTPHYKAFLESATGGNRLHGFIRTIVFEHVLSRITPSHLESLPLYLDVLPPKGHFEASTNWFYSPYALEDITGLDQDPLDASHKSFADILAAFAEQHPDFAIESFSTPRLITTMKIESEMIGAFSRKESLLHKLYTYLHDTLNLRDIEFFAEITNGGQSVFTPLFAFKVRAVKNAAKL
ncbi:hypothetical protein [Candidatus Nucleicultrix amoebiphila]|uniref:Uncharacterized protein n=1 Tax=Candidatus Nucleicultrix amoebiphila FS5 TaxID=1414854 RepID=A0A1W6N5G2_9PROT|nr:hypothetical protein [Candidatus Nucleicultrix amoebiphila]ARN85110.1 hypothetical protein GQ61_07195 [Candidatus Nucleicultrix amoebiphila FS5]